MSSGLSDLGRINLEKRWNRYLDDGGNELFERLKEADDESQRAEITSQIIDGLRTNVEVDYPQSSLVDFIEEKASTPVARKR